MISCRRFVLESLSGLLQGWNAFWFEPASSLTMGIARVGFGLWAALYAAAWFTELPKLIGQRGLLDAELTRYLIGVSESGTGSEGRLSILYWYDSPVFVQGYLTVLILAGIVAAMGIGGRWTVLAAFLLLLGIAHRIPMLQGPGDLMMIGMFGYLLFDAGKHRNGWRIGLHDDEYRASSNFAGRLLQTHFILWMFATFVSCLAEPMWWTGNATWWLAVAGRTVGWTRDSLVEHPYWVNLVTHAYPALMAGSLLLLTRRGCRTWGIVLGLMLAGLSFILCGDAIYAVSLTVALSAFLGAALTEWRLPTSLDTEHESETAKSWPPNARQSPKKRSRPGLARS